MNSSNKNNKTMNEMIEEKIKDMENKEKLAYIQGYQDGMDYAKQILLS